MPQDLALAECLHRVTQFHLQINAPVVCAEPPRLLFTSDSARVRVYSEQLASLSKELAEAGDGYKDQVLSRAAMALEELSEWLTAHAEGDLISAADAIGDRLYVLLGDAVATGFPLGALFEEVHRSNMTKLLFMHTGHGKGVKGPDYRRPEIARTLSDHMRSQIREIQKG
jgi:predicted HAD superfamily Cof-like phosphohydrolase